jgi:hypothetical protein
MILVALGVGAVFLVGLVVSGPVGGVLLLLVAAVLALISRGTWGRAATSGRPVHLLVLLAVVALAVAKLTGAL